ncbi:hypothetical protein [Pedococcus soli]
MEPTRINPDRIIGLTMELRSLIGTSKIHFHTERRPLLREIFGLDEMSSPALQYRMLIICLRSRVERLTDEQARNYDDPVMVRWAITKLLRLDNNNESADFRRQNIFPMLGIYLGIEALRRPFGPEYDLLEILAKALLEADEKEREAA